MSIVIISTDSIRPQPSADLEMQLKIAPGGGARIPTDDPDAALLFCQKFGQRSLSPRIKKIINASILILLITVALLKLYVVTEPEFDDKYLEEFYPVEAVQRIKDNHPAGELFNEYNWGGYLTWGLRDYPVFVDWRTDLYDNEILMEYLEIQAGRGGWEETLEAYGENVVLVEADSGLAHSLSSNERWRLAYADEKAVVFVRVDNY